MPRSKKVWLRSMKWMRKNMNRIIAVDFRLPGILNSPGSDDREQDPLQAAQIREGDVKSGNYLN